MLKLLRFSILFSFLATVTAAAEYSPVILTPSGFDHSRAYGISGGQQVGWGHGSPTGGHEHPLLWSGAADAYVDLHPSGFGFVESYALGISGGQQAGYGQVPSSPHALLWSGTPENCVDLNPEEFQSSLAVGISGGQQVGFGQPVDRLDEMHALLWSGTADSYVDLHPSGFWHSEAHDISGGQQVGWGLVAGTFIRHDLRYRASVG